MIGKVKFTVQVFVLLFLGMSFVCARDAAGKEFVPQTLWMDDQGRHINAHGGGMLFHDGKYYWFGENKSDTTNVAMEGVNCYSSVDLYHWKNEGIVLPVSRNEKSEIVPGCIMERPKVIYNEATETFVMWFHLELKGKGYAAARAGLAVSKHVTGPYRYMGSVRPNPGILPVGLPGSPSFETDPEKYIWWTPGWRKAVDDGLFVYHDMEGGQMSRDMTLFVDDDGKAYHIYASEENLTLHIAELSDDYQSHTGKYIRVFPGGHNEAPAIFKHAGKYYMITSGCTGWAPNAARLAVADSIMGKWNLFPNPCKGKNADLTFGSQGTFIFPVQGKKDAFIFMADHWNPEKPSKGTYVWLPIAFSAGLPLLQWHERWSLDIFDDN